MQRFQIFKVHRLSLINGFVFSTSFRTAAEGRHVKSPAQRSVNCKPLVQLFVAKMNVPPTTTSVYHLWGGGGEKKVNNSRNPVLILRTLLTPSALSPPKRCSTEIWWFLERKTATEKKSVRLLPKLAGFASQGWGLGWRLAAKRSEAAGGRAGRAGAKEAGERGSEARRAPGTLWPNS